MLMLSILGYVVLLWHGVVTTAQQNVSSPADGSTVSVSRLLVESEEAPLGLDVLPRFSWVLGSDQRSVIQESYHLQVFTEDVEEPVWDSGIVASFLPYGHEYAGPALQSDTTYSWTLDVITNVGEASGTSTFSTGFLDEDDWGESVWIAKSLNITARPSHTLSLNQSLWIWTAEMDATVVSPGSRGFRKRISTPTGKAAVTADILITVDDDFVLFVNGVRAGIGFVFADPAFNPAWRHVPRFNVSLEEGDNVIAVEAINHNGTGADINNPAGLLAAVLVEYDDGTTDTFISDSSWLTTPSAPPTGFEQPDFDDSSWEDAATFGLFGTSIQGNTDDFTISDPFTEHPAPLIRKEFNVPNTLSFARLYYSVGGFAHITLNGVPASDRVLTPGFTNYDTQVQSVTLDVQDLLVEGINVIGIELGRSHYGITQDTRAGWEDVPWHGEPSVRIVLSMGFSDGTTSRLVSDSSWSLTEGPTRLDDIFGGENYDATQAVEGYDLVGFDDSSWENVEVVPGPRGEIVNQLQPPIRIVGSLSPINISQPVPSIYVVAFDRNFVGVVNITLSGAAGTLITVHCAEKLKDDGTIAWDHVFDTYANNYQTDRFWLAGTGETETFEPKFSWKGFQYLQIEGWPDSSEPTVDNFVGRVIHDDMQRMGGFQSSSDLLNTLHTMAVDTMLFNSHSYPQDCPTYEKNGWSGDAVLSTDSYLSNLDSQNFLSKYVRDLDDSRSDPLTNGAPQVIAPSGGVSGGIIATPWHSAFILIPEFLHRYRGDLRTLTTHYDSMKEYVNIELARSPGGIANTMFGDWLTSEVNPLGGNPPEDRRVPATAYLYKMFTSMINIATILNETEDAATFAQQASSIKDAFNANFFDTELGFYAAEEDANYRQSHNILAVAFDLTVGPEGTQSAVDSIVEDIRNRSTHMNTGALSTKYVLPVLIEHGHKDLAFEVLTQTTFPSWGFWVENGATTLWETWAVEARSHNHHFFGTFEDTLYMYVLGLQATSPAFQTVSIAPQFTANLASASGWMLTPFGNLTVSYVNATLDDTSNSNVTSSFTMDVQVPVGVTATIVIPKGSADDLVTEGGNSIEESDDVELQDAKDGFAVVTVGSGSYSFAAGL